MTEDIRGLKVFTYGTLMYPDVVEALIGREPTYSDGILMRWKKFSIPGSPFFLLPDDKGVVQGRIIHNVNIAELKVFDEYENVESKLYERVIDNIKTHNSITRAYFYIAGEMFLKELEMSGDLDRLGYRLKSSAK